MPSPSAVPTQIIFPSAPAKATRRLCVRNLSAVDLAVKFVFDDSILSSEFSHVVVPARKHTFVSLKLNKAPSGAKYVYVYARPVTLQNYECLKKWCKNKEVKPTQLAHSLKIVAGRDFSAQDTILDLPHKCLIVEGVPQAKLGVDAADTYTCVNVNKDCLTAEQAEALEMASCAATASAPAAKCWLSQYISDYLFPDPPNRVHINNKQDAAPCSATA